MNSIDENDSGLQFKNQKYKPVDFSEIEKRAENVLKKYNITECPADHLREIIDGENIKYLEISQFSEGLEGLYKRSGDKIAIFIRQTVTPPERKTFTIAHELGHHFMEHYKVAGTVKCRIDEKFEHKDANKQKKRTPHDIQEKEANVFAAALLMPEKLLLPVVFKALKITDRERYGRFYLDNQSCNKADWFVIAFEMKNHFKTSKTAGRWRLHNLGYADWKVKD